MFPAYFLIAPPIPFLMNTIWILLHSDTLWYLEKYSQFFCFFSGCPVWATPEGYTIEKYGDKVIITCETTEEFVLLECQGTRWIQKYPVEDETEISFPPCS